MSVRKPGSASRISSLPCGRAWSVASRGLAVAALAVLPAVMSATHSQAAIVVRLEQVGGVAVATPGIQTVVQMLVKASGTGSPLPLNTVGYAAAFAWSSSDADVADLYNVLPDGSGYAPGTVFFSGSVVSNTPGYLFANLSPQNNLTTNGVQNPVFERALNVDVFSPVTLTDPLAETTIASLYFAVSPDVLGTFTFEFDTSAIYGFVDPDFNTFPVLNGGGTLQVVPEPATISGVLALGLLAVFWRLRRVVRLAAG